MKTLTPAQEKAVKASVNAILEYGSALNSSKTGTGKTVMAVHTAIRMRCPVAVIAPKATLPHWRRELEAHGITPVFVSNYEKIRGGRNPFLKKQGKRSMRWNLPEGTLLVFDEVGRMRNPYTLNSLMLISAKMQGVNTLLLSATAAEDPTQMRASGYALELHSLNRANVTHLDWVGWMKKHGCSQDAWGGWRPGNRKHLAEIHKVLYKDRAVRLTEADMPEAFRENLIIEESIEFAALPAIKRFYKEAGITPAIVEAYVEKQNMSAAELEKDAEADPIVVRMLRARQMAEASKLPELVEMSKDLLEEGFSVVVFLNFRETILAYKATMDKELGKSIGIVIGGQDETERTKCVEDFRDDRSRVIVCSVAAGGTGLDGLQDTHGRFKRASLISPSFSAQDMTQVLGRLPRAFSKSGVIQKILIAADTVEEYVLAAINRKIANLETLHGS